MYIGNNYMVNANFYNRPLHQEYFIDEKSAREYANRLYKMDSSKRIELFRRVRGGYKLIKGISRHHEGSAVWI